MEVNYYRDKKTGKLFQRVIAGVGWPGDRPGGVVVLGDETSFGPRFEHYLLDEIEESDTGLLFKHCLDLQGKYNVENFVGRLDDANLRYLSQWNFTRRNRNLSMLYILSAPFVGTGKIGYHIGVLKDKLRTNQKSLFLLVDIKQPGYLLELQASETGTILDVEMPLVAALGYAVSALTEWGFYDYNTHKTAIVDYDIFNH